MKLKELIMQAWEIAFLKQFTNFSPTEKHFICIIGKNYARLLIKKKNFDQINYPYIYGNNNTWLTYNDKFP